jgi:hypothetical protein
MDHDSVSSRKSTLFRAISGDKRHFLSAQAVVDVQARGGLRSRSRRRPVSALWLE